MNAATAALLAELDLTPKPGLVDREHAGAHRDMDRERMADGACALDATFARIARTGRDARVPSVALRETLGALGRDGECAMLRATGGVNTHRGAIWSLGLLCAAAHLEGARDPHAIAARAGALARLPDRFGHARASHGALARVRYGCGGARSEAARGFPAVTGIALPVLRRGGSDAVTRALLALIAMLDDSCLVHRGGLRGLRFAQRGARRALREAGAASIRAFDRALVEARLSPGGSADALAAALYLDAVAR